MRGTKSCCREDSEGETVWDMCDRCEALGGRQPGELCQAKFLTQVPSTDAAAGFESYFSSGTGANVTLSF